MTESSADSTAIEDAISIVFCADNRFVLPLAVAIYSLAVNNSAANINIFIIDGGINDENKARLIRLLSGFGKKVKLAWLNPALDNSLVGLPGMQHLSQAAYLRLLITDLLPSDMQRVIYLDCDLLVRADLAALWQMSFAGAAVLAVPDTLIASVSADNAIPETYRAAGLHADDPYFNSGVMVIDLIKWRIDQVATSVVAFLKENTAILRWADQDGLNAVLGRQVKYIDPRWNYQCGRRDLNDIAGRSTDIPGRRVAIHQAFVLHFTGERKPWISGMLGPERNEFLFYLYRSNWLGTLGFMRFIWPSVRFTIYVRYIHPLRLFAGKLLRSLRLKVSS